MTRTRLKATTNLPHPNSQDLDILIEGFDGLDKVVLHGEISLIERHFNDVIRELLNPNKRAEENSCQERYCMAE